MFEEFTSKMLILKLFGVFATGATAAVLSYSYSKQFSDWLRFQSLGTRDYIVERLGMMFIEVDPNQVLLALAALSVIPALIVFALFLPMVLPGGAFALLMVVVGWKAPKPIVDYLYKRRVEQFVFQMVDGLNLMSNGMKSGLSVAQSIGLVVQEMPDPIRQEFGFILSQTKMGASLEESLNNLSKRIISDDVEMFVTSVNILKETGGNLAETFDTITTTIRERIKVEKKIAALTAQGLYQGMFVMAIPPILGVVFYQSDPEFMQPLFTTALGWIIILIIILLEAVGFFVILKVIKIDV